MLRILAGRTRYCDRFRNLRVHEVPVTALSTPIDKSRFLQLCDKLPHLRRHQITLLRSMALALSGPFWGFELFKDLALNAKNFIRLAKLVMKRCDFSDAVLAEPPIQLN